MSLFNHKARLWVDGRKGIFEKVKKAINPEEKIAWIHCASLGEFEQGRPVIEALKKEIPELKIFLTFFSPSGFEVRKNYTGADYIFYLPHDSKKNARLLINLVKPQFVVFVKYEFWYYYLSELHNDNIPAYLISAIFRKNQVFFKWYGEWYRNMLFFFRHIFVQDNDSLLILNKEGITNVTVAGDTRFDRVFNVSMNTRTIPDLEKFCDGKFTVVAGSTWQKDDELLAGWFMNSPEDLKLIIAPHEIHESRISWLEKQFEGRTIRFSKLNSEINSIVHTVLIIDNIGMLSSVYRYGKIAYIGGGFGKGIHNILEAATFGLPVIFGPNFSNFREACELINLGGASSISNIQELKKILDQMILSYDLLKKQSLVSGKYVQSNIGATKIIMDIITEFKQDPDAKDNNMTV